MFYYTYIIQSTKFSDKFYYGYTSDLCKRLENHNKGQSRHTSKYIPWSFVFFAAFPTMKLAKDFEKYLKSASGRAFLKKRLISMVK
jgi:putative endonuclease